MLSNHYFDIIQYVYQLIFLVFIISSGLIFIIVLSFLFLSSYSRKNYFLLVWFGMVSLFNGMSTSGSYLKRNLPC